MLKKTINIIVSIAPLFLGGIIYIIFRSQTLKMFHWFSILGITDLINIFRDSFTNNFSPPYWVIYNLPDGLWLFSYTSIMIEIWRNKLNYESIFWIFIIPTIAILSEFFQLLNIISGTFDLLDLLFYTLGTLFPIIFYLKTNKLNIYNYEQKI